MTIANKRKTVCARCCHWVQSATKKPSPVFVMSYTLSVTEFILSGELNWDWLSSPSDYIEELCDSSALTQCTSAQLSGSKSVYVLILLKNALICNYVSYYFAVAFKPCNKKKNGRFFGRSVA